MALRRLAGYLVMVGVALVWLRSLGLRLPYMDQVPVFDGDAMTSEASMWARMWWHEGPLKMWFSTPVAPPSIEVPTRELYESWPPGAFVPVYLIALLLGREPSIPMVNWINTCEHGLIALAAAFSVYNIALLNRIGRLSSVLIAIGVSLPILLSRGPLYIFSQIYDTSNAVLINAAAFILLETLFYGTQSARHKQIITALQLVTIFLAFTVDWLAYTLFAFWVLSRLAAGYLGVEPRLKIRSIVALGLVPAGGLALFLVWRFFAPNSMAKTAGFQASIDHLVFKVMQRMNMTDESPISGFTKAFIGEMHASYFSSIAFALIVGSSLATLALTMVSFSRTRDPARRRAFFATGAILFLVTVPLYLQMIILHEHTFIHRWVMMKVMLPYGIVPFGLLPIAALAAVRLFAGETARPRFGLSALGLVVAIGAIAGAERITRDQYLLGRVDRDAYHMWDDIGRNDRYQDVVVSPVLEAPPMSVPIGASDKLVHLVKDFAEVDRLVAHVCGDFNVVVALPEGADAGEFGSRPPSEVIDTGRVRLLRFAHYKGKGQSCS